MGNLGTPIISLGSVWCASLYRTIKYQQVHFSNMCVVRVWSTGLNVLLNTRYWTHACHGVKYEDTNGNNTVNLVRAIIECLIRGLILSTWIKLFCNSKHMPKWHFQVGTCCWLIKHQYKHPIYYQLPFHLD